MPDTLNQANGAIPDSITPVAKADDSIVIPALPEINLGELAMPSNVAEATEKAELSVMLGMPGKMFFRTRPGYVLGTPANPIIVVKLNDEIAAMLGLRNEKYRVVHPSIVPHLDRADYQRVVLHAAVTIPGALHLIPVRVDGDAGWATSARSAVAQAQVGWLRLVARKQGQGYEIRHGSDENPPAPAWPANVSFDTIVKLALKDRMITDLNHPVVRGLQGRW